MDDDDPKLQTRNGTFSIRRRFGEGRYVYFRCRGIESARMVHKRIPAIAGILGEVVLYYVYTSKFMAAIRRNLSEFVFEQVCGFKWFFL